MSRDGSDEDIDYPDHLLSDGALAAATATPPRSDAAAAAEDDDDDNEAASAGKKKLKTLRELAEGPNKEAALNEIEDKVYTIATLMNFIALRLVNSSGGRPPYIFDKDTRRYILKNPRINVHTPDGRPPPFVPSRGDDERTVSDSAH